MAEQSRTEEILRATIDGDEYTKTPQSREEELLIELKQTIEAGGGASVVPNPEGEATETLTKLGVNDTVYGIPKELPAVTSADAGDVLGVNSEGQWDKMTASGGTEIIELVGNSSLTAYTLPNDMTNAQLYDMISNSPSKYIIKAYFDPKTGYTNDRNNVYMRLSFDDDHSGNKHIFTGLFYGHTSGNWYICEAYIVKNQDNSSVYVGKIQLTLT